MKIRFLGTGTSTGIPEIGCKCAVCQSSDKRDKRLRSSALITVDNTHILIDCGPDFREQMLHIPFEKIDGVLLTHEHYDHVGGLDDLRPFCRFGNIPLYTKKTVAQSIQSRMPYIFADKRYPGVPSLDLIEINDSKFSINGIEITPLRIMHYKLEIFGYRIGRLAYITDMKTMPIEEFTKLEGVETLVVNALRIKEHLSHQNLEEAIAFASKVEAKQTYFIHMSHDMGLHDTMQKQLPENIYFAHDGLELEFK